MYTNLENVQIIISLLKQHGVKHLVLSPGNRDIPLVHSVETDKDFVCYSIVDERSAAYFALGIAEANQEPVGFVCTSSTASCNYMPAIEEASRKNICLIALTADRENYLLYQFEDQKINQTNMYAPFTKYCADLPVVRNELDYWLCIRKANEALIAMKDGECGPVQINFQVNRTDFFPVRNLPKYRKITKVYEESFKKEFNVYHNQLKRKSIMVLVGENYYGNDELCHELDDFQKNYNAVVISDHFSNLEGDFIDTAKALEVLTPEDFEQYVPDLVITVGGHIWSALKYSLRNTKKKFEHWRISEDDIVKDGFKELTTIFAFSAEEFFAMMNKHSAPGSEYRLKWLKKANSIRLPELRFTNFYAISEAMKKVPDNSIIHCSILNSARLNAFSKYSGKRVKTYCNFGCDGIDGCMSSFLGQTCDNTGLSILIIGDLSFIYDLNVTFENFTSDKRILLINNHAGSEFHTAFGLKKFPMLDTHISAGHQNNISEVIDYTRFKYISARNREELDSAFHQFYADSDKPILLEVFTNAKTDGDVLNEFYGMNRKYSTKTKIKQKIKGIIRGILKV